MSRDGADRFLPLAIEIVKQAIALDGEGKFKEAYYKYKEALERFMTVRAISLSREKVRECCRNTALHCMPLVILCALFPAAACRGRRRCRCRCHLIVRPFGRSSSSSFVLCTGPQV